MRRLLLATLFANALHAMDAPWPDLPDPNGLGSRLATIAWLEDRGTVIPAGATDGQILAWYATRSGESGDGQGARPPEQGAAYRIRQAERDAAERLRSQQAQSAAERNQPSNAAAAEAPKPAAGPSAGDPVKPPPASDPPMPITIANREDWAENYMQAQVATRGGLAVTIYLKRGDSAHYFAMVVSSPGASGAKLVIDDASYLTIAPSQTAMLLQIPALSGKVNPSPVVVLNGL